MTIYIILQGHLKAQYLKMGLCPINSITNLLDGISGNTFKEQLIENGALPFVWRLASFDPIFLWPVNVSSSITCRL